MLRTGKLQLWENGQYATFKNNCVGDVAEAKRVDNRTL